jgi:2'-5' RNA ligase
VKTDAMTTFESALVVPFPGLEPVVSPHRSALDSGAIRGVPAHVTVLYPFMPPERLSASVLAELGRLLAEIAPFDTTFDAVDWFGDGVVYLRPTPDRPLRQLTAMVAARWPDWPPYGGVYGEPTPHLTIGDRGTRLEHARAAETIARALPIEANASEVHVYTGTREPRSWTKRAVIALGGSPLADDDRANR